MQWTWKRHSGFDSLLRENSDDDEKSGSSVAAAIKGQRRSHGSTSALLRASLPRQGWLPMLSLDRQGRAGSARQGVPYKTRHDPAKVREHIGTTQGQSLR
ncbi:hypothetical protein Scep_014557 [Stephania cephalantha]|uniref:Uncharacterized protein n=1 Tax=Stephania cephalantha TaxID=152367 RepID=A0AAP0P352_9MAGN